MAGQVQRLREVREEGSDGSGSREWVVGLGRGSGVPKGGFEAGAEVGGGRRGAKAESDAQG
jgi:hypothetical protein